MEGESLPFLREDVFSDFWWISLEMVAWVGFPFVRPIDVHSRS